MSLITEAVLLRSVPYQEADLVVTLYTRDRGKLSAMARGARGSKRRFGAGLALFVLARAELRPARSGDLWTLTSFDVVRDFRAVAGDIAAMAHASYGVELVRELAAPEQPDVGVLDLLVELFETLFAVGASPIVLRAFELRLLAAVGLAPALDRCIGCGTDASAELDAPGASLDGVRGGVACHACAAPGATAVMPLSAPARAVLLAARSAASLVEAHRGAAESRDGAVEARDAMLATLLAHIGKPLRSVEFIVKMSGAALRAQRTSGERT